MSERVRRAHGQHGEGTRGIGEYLNDVVDGAIAAAGEDGVTSGENGLTGMFESVGAGMRENEFGVDACAPQQSEHRFQLLLAAHSVATGVGVEEQDCLAHGLSRSWIVL